MRSTLSAISLLAATTLFHSATLAEESTSHWVELREWYKWDFTGAHVACSLYIEDVLGCTGWTKALQGHECRGKGGTAPNNCGACQPYENPDDASDYDYYEDDWYVNSTTTKATSDDCADIAVYVDMDDGFVDVQNAAGEMASCHLPWSDAVRLTGWPNPKYDESWRFQDGLWCDPTIEF